MRAAPPVLNRALCKSFHMHAGVTLLTSSPRSLSKVTLLEQNEVGIVFQIIVH